MVCPLLWRGRNPILLFSVSTASVLATLRHIVQAKSSVEIVQGHLVVQSVLILLTVQIVGVLMGPFRPLARNILIVMLLLQLNIQSINSSRALLKEAVDRLNVDVILLQEVWTPEVPISLPDFQPAVHRARPASVYSEQQTKFGGVALLFRNSVKAVERPEFNVPGLEATWVEMCFGPKQILVGSVYINVNQVDQLHLLDSVIARVSQSHQSFIVGMDANSRNLMCST